MLPLRYGSVWLAVGWLMVLATIVVSLLPGLGDKQVVFSDKLGHFSVYLCLMVWFAGIYPGRRYPWIAAALLLLGAGLEWLQSRMGHRQGEVADLLANATGIGVGVLLAASLLGGWCQRLERRLFG